MKIIDRIAVNRLILILTNFVLTILKMLNPKGVNIDVPKPPKRKIIPWKK